MMSDPSRRAVILGGARTPFGKLSGSLATQTAVDLGVLAARAAIERAGISPADVRDTIFGQVVQGGSGQNPAGRAASGRRHRDTRGNDQPRLRVRDARDYLGRIADSCRRL